jgi:hypothetical protein
MGISNSYSNERKCSYCGYINPAVARICEQCKSSLVETAPPPQQVSALQPAGRQPALSEPEPLRTRPLRESRAMGGRVRGRASGLADQLRMIASGAEVRAPHEEKKPFWMDWKIAAIGLAFLGMLNKRGHTVVEDTDHDGLTGIMELFDGPG